MDGDEGERERENKRQKRRQAERGKVVYVATLFRLVGIDLDDIESGSKSYQRAGGLPCRRRRHLYRWRRNLRRKRPLFDYKRNIPSGQNLQENLLIPPLEGAGYPIVETLAGKTYILMPSSSIVNFSIVPDCPSPMFELLHHGNCSSTPLDDSLLMCPENPIHVVGHFVIANRLFLILWSFGGEIWIACFDPTAGSDGLGEWINTRINSHDILQSFRSLQGIPLSIKCISVCVVDDDHGDVDCIGSGLHVILFQVEYPYQNLLYFAGVCTEYGILLCYQDITEEIFN